MMHLIQAKSLLTWWSGRPYPYLFLEHSSRGSGMASDMQDAPNRFGFMQYYNLFGG